MEPATAAKALEGFDGVQRRFTIRGEEQGVMVVDDYGHHPTEIRATLQGARVAGKERVIAVFQPHRYTRVRDHFEGFATAFYDADAVLITPVYAAGEAPIEGMGQSELAAAIREHGHSDVADFASEDALVAALIERVQPGDLVVTLGAGDVWRVGKRLLDALSA